MDYQFIRNDRAEPAAIFEMGAETLGLWFSEELGRDRKKLAHILTVSYTHLTLPTSALV